MQSLPIKFKQKFVAVLKKKCCRKIICWKVQWSVQSNNILIIKEDHQLQETKTNKILVIWASSFIYLISNSFTIDVELIIHTRIKQTLYGLKCESHTCTILQPTNYMSLDYGKLLI